MTKWLAKRLRRIADRIDYTGSPKGIGWSFTIEQGEGIRFREDGADTTIVRAGSYMTLNQIG